MFLTFKEWFAEYNRQYGMPPADVVAKAAWDYAYQVGWRGYVDDYVTFDGFEVEGDRDTSQQG